MWWLALVCLGWAIQWRSGLWLGPSPLNQANTPLISLNSKPIISLCSQTLLSYLIPAVVLIPSYPHNLINSMTGLFFIDCLLSALRQRQTESKDNETQINWNWLKWSLAAVDGLQAYNPPNQITQCRLRKKQTQLKSKICWI